MHNQSIQKEHVCQQFGVTSVPKRVQVRTSPASKTLRKDFNFVSQGIILAERSQCRIGCNMPMFLEQLRKSETIIRGAAKVIDALIVTHDVSQDDLQFLFDCVIQIPSPIMMRYLDLILEADRVLSLLLILLAYNHIDSDGKIKYYGEVRRALIAIKIAAQGIEPFTSKKEK
ncbi:MAG: hypothetical protein KGI54_05910 [Pseudomonadota bacterium]|nr:hypothetical protein [Pseudomonadota bacterium]